MDTVVCEADHLSDEEVHFWSSKQVLDKIQSRQESVADAILRETKPHDLIMLEGPVERTPLENLAPYLRQLPKEKREAYVRHADFYADIAEYAKSIGRRVQSMDSGLNRRFAELSSYLLGLPPALKEESELAAHHQRDRIMEKRIKKFTPKLVVTTREHSYWLLHTIKPRKFISEQGSFEWWQIEGAAKKQYDIRLEKIARLNQLRNKRRTKINQNLKRRK